MIPMVGCPNKIEVKGYCPKCRERIFKKYQSMVAELIPEDLETEECGTVL